MELALEAPAVHERKGLLTAVAIAVESDHTIAFLGTSTGEVYRVHLSSSPAVYGVGPRGSAGSEVNRNLFFDRTRTHLYITTDKKITKMPVQECHLKTTCEACMEQRDPYCGWCVLEGRCSRMWDCKGAEQKNGWLWSPGQQCVQIQSFNPPNISCRRTQQVEINVPSLPVIKEDNRLHCKFGSSFTSNAVMEGSVITCSLPEPAQIPLTPEKQDFVAVPVQIFVDGQVEVADGEFKFYNCSAAIRKAENIPCMSCVSSDWGCQWNTLNHTCSDNDDSIGGAHVIKNQQATSCPRFESQVPSLIPVGFKTPIRFKGVNLDVYKDKELKIGTELMKHTEEAIVPEGGAHFRFEGYEFAYDKAQTVDVLFYVKDRDTDKKIDSTLNVTLYNCSLGREDCSLCKNAEAQYECVWCARTRSCVYRELCTTDEASECPSPTITNVIPRYGPLKGGILVTIRGSNLGIRKQDIKSITVAGVPCAHQLDRYSVSTSVVCEVGPVDMAGPLSGMVEVEVQEGKRGASTVHFTYRDPKPESVQPEKGPKAGGTVITISGTDLDTATKEDLNITVGGVLCPVETFGSQITCKMGEYKAAKEHQHRGAPGLPVLPEPQSGGPSPQEQLRVWREEDRGDRHGFNLIQEASMRVLHTAEGCPGGPNLTEFVQEALKRNDTVLEFLSPTVGSGRDSQCFEAYVYLDNVQIQLKPFAYHSDPIFYNLTKQVITETGIICVNVRPGFAKAMTAKEAQAFVGDVSCQVTTLQDDKLFLETPPTQPKSRSRQKRDTSTEPLDLLIKFGNGEWVVGSVHYERKYEFPLAIIIPAVVIPMLLIIAISVYCYRRKSQQAEREYEKVKHQLENLEESVRDRCKKEFTDLMIEMEDHTSDLSEARIPFLDYKTYTDRVFFLPSKDGANDVMITGKVDIPEARRAVVAQALNQFSNLLNSKTFINAPPA
ncbi:hypothetical protein AAFF_G00060760 [Aldrovandia affinis]|uniref:Sema domain-containing protein n=1 Tax=Aldrovandia affinis TaxID=143900 RepID=A0AAD7RZR8_9TELE|nr:hypothetical protein AAFF_G00060760 [Aldrovandia affinis]